ncbi:MAG: hypothetical protein FJ104_12040 [Deltaproteobacteria bacterium]|nr:hypothetical protein [Deltaproteobacteria bacterium]
MSLTLGAAETRLDAPYPLRVYCEETLPLAARDPVTGVVRVSACAGPDSAPPCLYVALAGERLLLGVLVTAEGETLDVVSGSLVASEATPGGLRGELFLEVAGSDGGRSPVGATFRGCDPFRPPPPASGA